MSVMVSFDSFPRHTANWRRRQLLGAGLAAAVATVGGPALAQDKAGDRVLRVGHQKGWLSILKSRGTLEKRLGPLGGSGRWIEVNAGPVQLEARNGGALAFGAVAGARP